MTLLADFVALCRALEGVSGRIADAGQGAPAGEQRQAQRFLQSGDPAGNGRLAYPERAAGRQRAAVIGDSQEIAQVVPVQHVGPLCAGVARLAFCNYAERYHKLVAYEN